MPEKITDLRLKEDSSTIVRPNIVPDNIPSGAVTTAKLAAGAVTSAKIDGGAVTEGKIASSAVTAGKIGSNAVTEAKILDGSVTSGKIAAGAVTTAKIAAGAITEEKIGDHHITPIKFANSWATLGVEIYGQAVTDWAGFKAWCFDLYQSFGFFRLIYLSGNGLYPLEIYIDQDNGEIQFMRLDSTGYVSLGSLIDSDAAFTSFMTSYGDDIYILRF